MKQMALHQESAYERLYRWLQSKQTCFYLDLTSSFFLFMKR
jgi:hypothetical protein